MYRQTYKEGICRGCGDKKLIVYVSGQLCFICNCDRKRAKQKPIRQISARGQTVIKEDEKVYEMVWNTRPHRCEECGCALGDRFRDDNRRVIDRFRYSHILTKGAHPELRHNLLNFNLLCLLHHQQWETGLRKEMRIYEKNQRVINKLLSIIQ